MEAENAYRDICMIKNCDCSTLSGVLSDPVLLALQYITHFSTKVMLSTKNNDSYNI